MWSVPRTHRGARAVNLFIHDPKHPSYVAHSSTVNELLGLGPKGKIPVSGMPEREIQGITVWVRPLPPGTKQFRLRVMCICPACQKVMPVGRLHQHSKVHTS